MIHAFLAPAAVLVGAMGLLAACSADAVVTVTEPAPVIGVPPVPRDTITALSWQRQSLAFPSVLGSTAVRTGTTLLTVSANTVTAINPGSGAPFWSRTYPSAPGAFAGAGDLFRLAVGDAQPAGAGGTEDLLDAKTGVTIWSQALTAVPRGKLLATSATMTLEQFDDSAFIGRDRSTGAVRWVRRVTTGPCGFIENVCFASAGYAAGAFYVVWLPSLSPSGVPLLIRLTDDGTVTRTPIADPIGSLFTLLRSAAVDSAARVVVVVNTGGVFAVDAMTGARRWSVRHLFVSDGVVLSTPIVHISKGNSLLIHLLYPYPTPVNGSFAREGVVDATTGKLVRQLLRPGNATDVAYAGGCGNDGVVIVRKAGDFTYVDSRTGVETAGIIRNPVTNNVDTLPFPSRWSADFESGHLLFATGSQPDGLFGFRCRP